MYGVDTTTRGGARPPPWLSPLSLDGYSAHDQLAFEVQGPRHYSWSPIMAGNNKSLVERLSGKDALNMAGVVNQPLTGEEAEFVAANISETNSGGRSGRFTAFIRLVCAD